MSSEDDQDARWVEGVRCGDDAAFAALVRAYYAGLFDFACTVTRRPEAAEDLVQDVLLRVWEGRRDWRPEGSAKAYLYRAVRNRALNYVRDQKARRAETLDPEHLPAAGAGTPEADLAYQALLADYQSAVDELPERRQLVYRLSRLYGLTYEEVAAALGVSINTVRTQMTGALRHLRDRLARHLE